MIIFVSSRKTMNKLNAVIFDLDGTLLDNNDFHLKSWKQYLKQIGMEISDEDYKANISGRTNKDATEHVFNKKMTNDEAEQYYLEKEKIYRELYATVIKPVNGLINLLTELQQNGIKMAIATSGILVNIDFMFDHVPIRHFFEQVINSTHIQNGKPDPEIFITTAQKLQVDPENCIIFEDSIAGVEAANAAGMKVVALTTTHTSNELYDADLVIDDYTQISYSQLVAMLEKTLPS